MRATWTTLVVLLISACSSGPVLNQAEQGPLADLSNRHTFAPPTFGYTTPRFERPASFVERPQTYQEEGTPAPPAVEGAIAGGFTGLFACGQLIAGGPVGAALFLVCAPFGTTIGAVAGAASAPEAPPRPVAAAPSPPTPTLAERNWLETSFDAASKGLNLSALLADELSAYARTIGEGRLRNLLDQGPRHAMDFPRYRSNTDYIIEVAITSVRVEKPQHGKDPYGFVIELRGRLIRASDNYVLDSYSRSSQTTRNTLEEWMADPESASRALRSSVATLARAFLDDWVVIYRDYAVPSVTAGGYITKHVLRPLDWPIRFVPAPRANFESLFGEIPALVLVEDPTPVLRWEKIPEALAGLDSDADGGRIQKVIYDVRIFRPGDRKPVREIQVTEPRVKIEPPLDPCKVYAWTVRARFEWDGQPQMTEWSGMAGTVRDDRLIQQNKVRDAETRVGPWAPSYYYRFVTPAIGSKTPMTESDVLACLSARTAIRRPPTSSPAHP